MNKSNVVNAKVSHTVKKRMYHPSATKGIYYEWTGYKNVACFYKNN